MKFEIKHRWNGSTIFTAEISADDDDSYSVKLGLAVMAAVEARTDLAGADLADANLTDANLAGVYLARANLARANLARAYLARAYLVDANLADANLADANFTGANLTDANFTGAKNAELIIAKTRILPEGDIIGWKKLQNGSICKLRIPADAKRSHAFGRHCRAEFADVLDGSGVSAHDGKTRYAPGERVHCDKWNDNWQDECSGGIHFFITREEAEAS